ncbi:MAG TPA: hypothetical protein VD887_06425 [Allosphingosinicella sp.]|nr:hypothetical protein [Allosphingosinicella sp.]
MTHQPDQSTFAPNWETRFGRLRNDWLNSFARLELEICNSLSRLSGERFSKNKPLSQRVDELASLKPSPTCSHAAAAKLKDLAADCERLSSMRASIVHSVMVEGRRMGTPAALFQNVFEAARDVPIYLVMTVDDFISTRQAVVRLTQQLKALS